MRKSGFAILGGLAGGVIAASVVNNYGKKVIEDKNGKIDKFKLYYNVLNQWLVLKNKGVNLGDYLKNKGFNKIAIYGLGEMGSRLVEELQHTDIKIVYGIDKDVNNILCDIPIYSLDEINQSDEVDVIIVSAVFAFDEIEAELSQYVSCEVISLEEIIYGLI